MAVIWLVFLLYPINIVLGLADRSDRTLGLIGIGLFILAYVGGFHPAVGLRRVRRSRALTWNRPLFGVLIALTACLWVLSPDASSGFLPFLAAYAIYNVSAVGRALAVAAVLLFSFALAAGMLGGSVTPVPPAVTIMVATACTISRILTEVSIRHEQRRLSAARAQQRLDVARDVHDLLGHSLTVVHLKAQLAERLVELDPTRAREEIAQIRELSAEAITQVRATVADLRGAPPGDLAAQVEASSRALYSGGVHVEVQGSAADVPLPQRPMAQWILREATTNILRHADAQHAWIMLGPRQLRIGDDGRGLPPESAGDGRFTSVGMAQSTARAGLPDGGSGLAGMRERAAVAGAACRIGSRDAGDAGKRGTSVEVTW